MKSRYLDEPFHREFQFIDSQEKPEAARQKTRKHVTKEFYREKRYLQFHSQESHALPFSNSRPHSVPEFVVSVTTLNEPPTDSREPRVTSDDGAIEHSSDQNESSATEQGQRPNDVTDHDSGQSSPVSLLGAGRVDPFRSYPIEATGDVHELVDHCRATWSRFRKRNQTIV